MSGQRETTQKPFSRTELGVLEKQKETKETSRNGAQDTKGLRIPNEVSVGGGCRGVDHDEPWRP